MNLTFFSNRRQWFRSSGAGLLAGLAGAGAPAAASVRPRRDVYAHIGVQPIVNCKGTYTIISGSQSLPEVKAAMEEASRHYVHLDELMQGVGKRLAELTKAEYGIVTAGCAAALTHATAACIAGADPEKMQRLPQLDGLKNEVVMPRPSRNVYDHAIRMLGVRMVTPATREEFVASLRPATAMVALLGETLATGEHPMKLAEMAEAAHAKGIPIIVDAAAERLTVPNVYLTQGADMVAYSGGKCFRGPQCAGLLLGRKDLLEAAWINSAPHHAFGRSLKVGKEEIMGMLAAVEAWVVTRNHEAEWKQWEEWLDTIRKGVSAIPTVHTDMLEPRGPSNYAPQLVIEFDPDKLGMTGFEASDRLLSGNPRVIVPPGPRSLTVMPYMMMPGDDKIAAERIAAVLKSGPVKRPQAGPGGGDLSGQWDVEMTYVRGAARHTLFLEQKGQKVRGSHRGEFLSGEVAGEFDGRTATLHSGHAYEGTAIGYHFTGTLDGDTLRGKCDLEEYGTAAFVARRHFKG